MEKNVSILTRSISVRCAFMIFCMLLLFRFSADANNIQLKGRMNVTQVKNGVATLEFSMSWDNSWRDNYNWDAAWIILKYQPANASNPVWKPIRLKKEDATVNGGYTCQVNVTRTDTAGVLVYRSAKSGGTSDVQCSFRWPLPVELSGLTKKDFDENKIFFLVQGIEMVYIPYGAYSLGDGESVNTLRQGYKRMIPAEDDIIGTDASFVYSMTPSCYPRSNVNGPADRVNNSVWTDPSTNIAHISSVNHGSLATVNNSWGVDFKVPKTIRTFGVSGVGAPPDGEWHLQGSKDNITWETLWSGGAENFICGGVSYPVQHANRVIKPKAYRYYRIFIPKVTGASGIMLANVAMSEKDLFLGVDAPETSGVLKIIPENKDIINNMSGYTYSMIPSCYSGANVNGPADHVNNSIWVDPNPNFAHISSGVHGNMAGVNNYWIVDFKTPKTVRTFGVSGSSNHQEVEPASTWYLLASNDNATWDTVWRGGPENYAHDAISYPVQHGIRVQAPGAYRYYSVYIPKTKSGVNGITLANVAMSEEDLFPSATNTYLVGNEGKIAFGDRVSQIYVEDGTTWTGELAAAYPKGYKGFYVMKYEVSQEQYARFLNALTLAQQQALIPGLTALKKGEFIFGSKTEPTNRNGIVVSVPSDGVKPVVFNHNLNKNDVFGEDGDGMCVACNFMSINDMLAYCAWAGLRPMSELEYEKASRRPFPDKPVGGEYAWNDALAPIKLTGVNNEGMRLESANAGNANFDNGMIGPARCGVFATAASDQNAAGSTFWGVMEMSGNLNELCANVKHVAFDGALHGKGDFALNLWGTTPAGFGLRGGSFTSDESALRTSDRSAAALTDLTARSNSVGFRGVFRPDTNGVVITAGTITADKNLICSGSPVTLTGGEASVSDGSALSFRYVWYVKVGDGSFRFAPEGAGTTFRCEDTENTGSTKLKYTFKRKAICALGEAESNEVVVEVVNSAIRLSKDTLLVGVCGTAFLVEASAATDVPTHFDWVYNGNIVDTGRVYIPRLSAFGNSPGAYKYVVCKGNIGGCSRNESVVIDFSKKEALLASELSMADCGQKVWDERDGQCYTTVNIPGTEGRPDQCWFSQNLNTGKVVPGSDYATHTTAGIQKICYGDNVANCEKYGGLYRWEEAVNGEKNNAIKYVSGLSGPVQGICPDGWHMPSDLEFQTLEMNLGMTQAEADAMSWRGTDQGTQMKMPGTFEGKNWCTGADCNKSGFNGLPSGLREEVGGTYREVGLYGFWWTSTKKDSQAWRRNLNITYVNVYRASLVNSFGLSVRCIKNLDVASTEVTMENCGQVMVKDVREAEPQYYNTVKIPGTDGRPDQCWFSNNMNIGTVVAGSDYATHTIVGIQKICYGDNVANCAKYGGLYNWNETINGEKANAIKYVSGTSGAIQGICPDGWHVPSFNEWSTLEMNLGMDPAVIKSTEMRGTDQGTQMKISGTFEGLNWCTGADCNKSGFAGLPGGYCNFVDGAFLHSGKRGLWWTATAATSGNAWDRQLFNDLDNVRNQQHLTTHGFSVRCIKNSEIIPPTAVTLENCGKVTIEDDRASSLQYYNTVKIPGTDGRPDQCWLGRNINVGTRVVETTTNAHTLAGIQKICYSNSEANCTKYGGLYTWNETMYGEKANAIKYVSGTSGAVQGICPNGWHVPDDNDFKALEMNLGMTQEEVDKNLWRGTNQGSLLKIPVTFEGVDWCTDVADCNKTGFGSLPSGTSIGGVSHLMGIQENWWASTKFDGTNSWSRLLYNTTGGVYRRSYPDHYNFSVRCLKN